jgi:large subunit ribosomal protein L24
VSKWIKKDDHVLVIAGNDKGKVGTVISRLGDRVVVKGINVRKRHVKSKDRETASRILEKEMSIHISNTALCNEAGQKLQIKMRITEKGERELFYIENEKEVVHRKYKKISTH